MVVVGILRRSEFDERFARKESVMISMRRWMDAVDDDGALPSSLSPLHSRTRHVWTKREKKCIRGWLVVAAVILGEKFLMVFLRTINSRQRFSPSLHCLRAAHLQSFHSFLNGRSLRL